MAHAEGVREIIESGMSRAYSSYSEWTQFLDFYAKFYRYDSLSAAMIYAQRPNAMACASMDIWNRRMNRWIKRGSKGIRVLNPNGIGYRVVFDVSDTVGAKGTEPKIWSVQPVDVPMYLDYINAPAGDRVHKRI